MDAPKGVSYDRRVRLGWHPPCSQREALHTWPTIVWVVVWRIWCWAAMEPPLWLCAGLSQSQARFLPLGLLQLTWTLHKTLKIRPAIIFENHNLFYVYQHYIFETIYWYMMYLHSFVNEIFFIFRKIRNLCKNNVHRNSLTKHSFTID